MLDIKRIKDNPLFWASRKDTGFRQTWRKCCKMCPFIWNGIDIPHIPLIP